MCADKRKHSFEKELDLEVAEATAVMRGILAQMRADEVPLHTVGTALAMGIGICMAHKFEKESLTVSQINEGYVLMCCLVWKTFEAAVFRNNGLTPETFYEEDKT